MYSPIRKQLLAHQQIEGGYRLRDEPSTQQEALPGCNPSVGAACRIVPTRKLCRCLRLGSRTPTTWHQCGGNEKAARRRPCAIQQVTLLQLITAPSSCRPCR